jgi:hypothetical protein
VGGRGGNSGVNARSAEFKNSYNIEMENAADFEGHYALEKDTTKEALGYQMYVHKDVTGRSLIADTQAEIGELQRAYRHANRDGASYGMSQPAIDGMKAAIKEKIQLRQKAVTAMMSARSEYEKYSKETAVGNAKAKRRKGRWM